MFDVLTASLKSQRNTRGGEAVVRAITDQLAAGAIKGGYSNRSVQRSLGICAKDFGRRVKVLTKRAREELPDFSASLKPAKKARSDAFSLEVCLNT
jgi:hypothetical protein